MKHATRPSAKPGRAFRLVHELPSAAACHLPPGQFDTSMLAHYAEHVSQRQAECKLPNELLLLVKEYISLADLRTHVCYYHTCKTVASFYGDSSQQAEFWRRSCTLAGIGWLKADSSWKEIAFETIAKDGFCSHPRCGGALLDWNGEWAYA